MSNEHINVTLKIKGKKVDVRLPKSLMVSHLMKKCFEIFGLVEANRKYQIKVENKNILLVETDILGEYPLTNGDILNFIED